MFRKQKEEAEKQKTQTEHDGGSLQNIPTEPSQQAARDEPQNLLELSKNVVTNKDVTNSEQFWVPRKRTGPITPNAIMTILPVNHPMEQSENDEKGCEYLMTSKQVKELLQKKDSNVAIYDEKDEKERHVQLQNEIKEIIQNKCINTEVLKGK